LARRWRRVQSPHGACPVRTSATVATTQRVTKTPVNAPRAAQSTGDKVTVLHATSASARSVSLDHQTAKENATVQTLTNAAPEKDCVLEECVRRDGGVSTVRNKRVMNV